MKELNKFKISKNIEINVLDMFKFKNVPSKYLSDHYILSDKNKKREYLINSTVKYFIDKFSIPKSETEILKEIQAEVSDKSPELKKICNHFFSFLKRKKILLPENTKEKNQLKFPLFNNDNLVGAYKILQILSCRKYVDIYLVQNTDTNNLSVIKLLDQKKTPNKKYYLEELSEFKHEFKLLSKVKGKEYIINAHDFCEEKNYAYMVLEYADGVSVLKYINSDRGISEEDSYIIIRRILTGFSTLHLNNIIHGDIHASNILVLGNLNVKIIDLGLSRMVDKDETELMKFGGVDYYMPPERINTTSLKKYSKEPDFYSDVYQLGLILYLILYNTLPFEGFTWEELSNQIKYNRVECKKLSSSGFPINQNVISIMEKCLEKDPLNRFVDATRILEEYTKVFRSELVMHENWTNV